MKFKIKFKYSYIISILTSFIILCYFAYKGIIAYLIHKELYGGGVDVVITLRGIISLIMFFFIVLQIQFLKIKDSKKPKKNFIRHFCCLDIYFFFNNYCIKRGNFIFNNYLSNFSFNTFKSIKLKRANKRRKKYFNRKRNLFITAISKKKVKLIY